MPRIILRRSDTNCLLLARPRSRITLEPRRPRAGRIGTRGCPLGEPGATGELNRLARRKGHAFPLPLHPGSGYTWASRSGTADP